MDTDILVIGGGIAGVSAGARLAPEARVVLVDGEGHLAYHTSGRSAALYEPNYGPGPVVALSWASEDFFRGTEGLLSPRGFMLVAREDQRAAFEADCADFDAAQMPFEAAQARVPILNPATVAMAAIADHAEDIDTDRLIQGFAREIRCPRRRDLAEIEGDLDQADRWRLAGQGGRHGGHDRDDPERGGRLGRPYGRAWPGWRRSGCSRSAARSRASRRRGAMTSAAGRS